MSARLLHVLAIQLCGIKKGNFLKHSCEKKHTIPEIGQRSNEYKL